ncbi:LacI family DNA-binding transcriptional regulator [Microbacterium sp. CR_7]|uniref:LacI family DNA-binding transcriptional regulator n=1 Tax=Microbacterium sp. CR_7 TaxID=3055792 RepID=UPI0035C050D4
MSSKAISLKDVAAIAGVSVSTASKVLRGGGKASDATRERILEAAARLDYEPNALGQFLAQGRSATIGVLTLNAPGAFTMPVLTAATTALGARDLSVLVSDSRLDRAVVAATVRKFRARKVDGLLVVGDGSGTAMRSVTAGFTVPVVYAYGFSDEPDDVSFVHNGQVAGELAGRHLLGLGRRRIAHIGASLDDHSARERAEGLTSVLAAEGLELVGGAGFHGDWSRSWGRRAAEDLVASGLEFDAVFCGNDTIAMAASEVFRQAGLRIPADVAIVGFDNLAGLMDQHDRTLTTIDPLLSTVGERAAEYLADAIGGGAYEPGVHRVDGILIEGESSVGPRS